MVLQEETRALSGEYAGPLPDYVVTDEIRLAWMAQQLGEALEAIEKTVGPDLPIGNTLKTINEAGPLIDRWWKWRCDPSNGALADPPANYVPPAGMRASSPASRPAFILDPKGEPPGTPHPMVADAMRHLVDAPANRVHPDSVRASSPPDEFGWLIERSTTTGPEWWAVRGVLSVVWTRDASEAVRFAREIDAATIILLRGINDAKPTEHGWHTPSPEFLAGLAELRGHKSSYKCVISGQEAPLTDMQGQCHVGQEKSLYDWCTN